MKTLLKYSFLAIIIASCSGKPKLDVKNLQLPDGHALNFDRNAIKSNGIRRTIVTDVRDNMKVADTIWYDELGRAGKRTEPQFAFSLVYDDNGLPVSRNAKEIGATDYLAADSAIYEQTTNSDTTILSQTWKNSLYSSKHYFDKEGKLLKSIGFKKDNTDPTYTTLITYNGTQPVKIETYKSLSGNRSLFGSTDFYYTGEKIDSLTFNVEGTGPSKTKIEYDERGLPKARYYDGVLASTYVHDGGN